MVGLPYSVVMAQALVLDRPTPPAAYVTYEEFLALPGDAHVEWVDGEVVPMVSVQLVHARITSFLIRLLGALVDERGIGEVLAEPFNIRLTKTGRAPDVIVVLNAHMDRYRDIYLQGPPDLAIEVMSPGSEATDRGEKYFEYEAGGIPEYWLIDPEREVAEFYVLDERGRYRAVGVDDWFESRTVPGLRVRLAWFWERPSVTQALAEMAAASN